jgi:hypothetical protein
MKSLVCVEDCRKVLVFEHFTGFRDWILPVLVRYLPIGVRNKREIVRSFENMFVKCEPLLRARPIL